MSRIVRTCLLAIGTAALLAAPAHAEGEAASMSKEAGLGAGSAIASLVYAPVKLVYATGGLVVGGLAWAFSGGDSEVAGVILTPSVRGDYVVTPEQLRGKRSVEFFGRKPQYRPAPDAYASTEPDGSDGW